MLREDIDRGVDWHYAAFRAENAVATLGMTVQMLDVMVELFERGSEEIREWAPFARERLSEIQDLCDAHADLAPIKRARDERAAEREPDGD